MISMLANSAQHQSTSLSVSSKREANAEFMCPNLIWNLDGLDLKREKEQAIKMKKKKTYNEQEEIESQRRLQEQLQNIEPPHCGPKFIDVSNS